MKYILQNRLAIATLWVLVAFNGVSSQAFAQSCGSEYSVVRGDTLSLMAGRVYADPAKWSAIYGVNIPVIGINPNLIEIGQKLRIPCLDGSVVRAEPAKTVEQVASASQSASASAISFLTGDDYAPFTDRQLLNGGLITDIIVSALEANPDKPEYRISWENDWSQHLSPLLSEHTYDVGFPWLQPDCPNTPDDYRCRNFLFSNPLFQFLVLLYVNRDQSFAFENDTDIEGKTLCRPNGYFTHDLEKDGRFWLSQEKITLRQPDTINECFNLLREGSVDAVALNEFTGRAAMNRLSLNDKVDIIESRPLSIEVLHMVVHKDHPNASSLLDVINNSLTEFQLSVESEKVIDIHMTRFWSSVL